jgi:DNA primase
MRETQDDIVARIKEQADIVTLVGEHVELKRSGVRYLGRCPFHSEKTPSFSVHAGQQFYHCFGCGASGDVFSFMMKYHNLDFSSALKELAKRYHIDLPEYRPSREQEEKAAREERLYRINELCAGFFSRYLKEEPQAQVARDYLGRRGVGADLVARFGIGYAPAAESGGWNFLGSRLDREQTAAAVAAGLLVEKEGGGTYDRFRDRILFPLYNLSGRVCGFGGRIVGEGQPKYLNSPESPVFNKSKLLLGLFQQKEEIRKRNQAVLVEGNFDMVSLVAAGCFHVVAPLGTALTREQLRLLRRFAETMILLFDGDPAGRKAAVRAVPLFLAEQLSGRVAFLPSGHDPDTFVREKGLAALNEVLEKAKPLPEFTLEHLIAEHGDGLDGKRKIIEELQPLAAAATSPLQRDLFVAHFAEKLGLPVERLDAGLARPTVKANSPAERQEVAPQPMVTPPSLAQRQLLIYMIHSPHHFQALAEAGSRDCLAGSMGEVIFLALQGLVKKKERVEPEDLLTVLPEGPERRLVASLLTAPLAGRAANEGEGDAELTDFVNYLRQCGLKNEATRLLRRLEDAERAGDMRLLEVLLTEKGELDKRLLGTAR